MPSEEDTAVDAAVRELMHIAMPLMDQYSTAAALRALVRQAKLGASCRVKVPAE